MKRMIRVGPNSYSAVRRYVRRRRWNLFIYFPIASLLLLSVLLCYTSFTSPKPAQARSSSLSVRIMYVIRTSSKSYRNRLIYLLQTWILFVQKHVYFVTDASLPDVPQDHLLLTKNTCGGEETDTMKTRCCKTAHDFILFHRHRTKYDWFCHFDGDQYVHIKNLEKYLSTLDSRDPYYIGRNSWSKIFQRTKEPFPQPFWFATLDAGICLSKHLVHLLRPYTQNTSQFINGCLKENYRDDTYLGFLISAYLNVTLTKDFRFHSHLEKDFYQDKQRFFRIFMKQITFGFRSPHYYPDFLPKLYESQHDPFRLRTLHCLLYPYLFECQKKIRETLFNITT